MGEQKRPFDLLNDSLNKQVVIGMKAGLMMRGKMIAYDIHMNIILDDTEVLVNNEVQKKLGRTLVRGDTVVYISPSTM
ncbi:small nuclear ribonucleoprotein [Candidatus Micrarchaeota archaeon]|jgi:small nuclear ribonucleoprotein|nr:small nuclear ribonucleoprotein [Candidatus Micrarchaeota archaeon]